MLRLSKMTDYGIRILAHMARAHEPLPTNAREVASRVELPVPMVSKVMKSLARAGVLESHRGSKGGFTLSSPPERLSVADVVTALEGPVALTECMLGPSVCRHQGGCGVQEPLAVINLAVQNTLATITMADLINPVFRKEAMPLAEPVLLDAPLSVSSRAQGSPVSD